MKLNIIYPRGTLYCNNLTEIVALHLVEHLIYFDLKKKLNIDLLDKESFIGGISSGYLGFKLDGFRNYNLNFVKEYFSNLQENLKKVDPRIFLIEKRRIVEEENFYNYCWDKKLERLIFSKILGKKILNYNVKDYINTLKKLSFKDVLNFSKKFFDKNNFLILSTSGEKIKIIKSPNKYLIFQNHFDNLTEKELIIKTKNSPSFCVYLFIVNASFEDIFLYDLLINRDVIKEFINKNIIFGKSLAYGYFFYPTFYFLSTLVDFIIIPTTKPLKVKQEFEEFLKKEIYQEIARKFENIKKEEFKKSRKRFLKKFNPAIIKYCFTNKKVPDKKEILNNLSKLTLKDFKNFLLYNLKTVLIEVRSN